MSTRYPLQPALSLRRAERMRAEGELANALRAVERAEVARDEARAGLRAHSAVAERRTDDEQPGRLSSAVELQRNAAFAQRQALELKRLRAEVARCDAAVAQAQLEAQRAQAVLAAAHAQEQAVERDRARWDQGERRAALTAEQDEQDDQLAARRTERPR